LRFLSWFAKTGLSIVPFRRTRQLHTYTFKQASRPVHRGLFHVKQGEEVDGTKPICFT
jgi:hypothetical protein